MTSYDVGTLFQRKGFLVRYYVTRSVALLLFVNLLSIEIMEFDCVATISFLTA